MQKQMKCLVSWVTQEPKFLPTTQCQVGLYFLSNSFLMQAAMSFSMLNFSSATLAQSIASCCISSFISACLITALRYAVDIQIQLQAEVSHLHLDRTLYIRRGGKRGKEVIYDGMNKEEWSHLKERRSIIGVMMRSRTSTSSMCEDVTFKMYYSVRDSVVFYVLMAVLSLCRMGIPRLTNQLQIWSMNPLGRSSISLLTGHNCNQLLISLYCCTLLALKLAVRMQHGCTDSPMTCLILMGRAMAPCILASIPMQYTFALAKVFMNFSKCVLLKLFSKLNCISSNFVCSQIADKSSICSKYSQFLINSTRGAFCKTTSLTGIRFLMAVSSRPFTFISPFELSREQWMRGQSGLYENMILRKESERQSTQELQKLLTSCREGWLKNAAWQRPYG